MDLWNSIIIIIWTSSVLVCLLDYLLSALGKPLIFFSPDLNLLFIFPWALSLKESWL